MGKRLWVERNKDGSWDAFSDDGAHIKFGKDRGQFKMCIRDSPLHKVLSFVRRSGRLDDRLQRAWDNYAGTYLLDICLLYTSRCV